MIPKVIHYCWFGNKEIPSNVKKCIDSWREKCPDYEIICWNEKNYSIDHTCEFVRNAYKCKKWAFVSDYARLDIVYRHGGIYLDTDVELIKPLSPLIEEKRGFFGFEQPTVINTGIGFACEKQEPILKEMMEIYAKKVFNPDNMFEFACPIINTYILEKHGLLKNNEYQIIEGIQILPTDYLCPENLLDGSSNYTNNTVSIHHYNASWVPQNERYKMKAIILVKKLLPNKMVQCIRRIVRCVKRRMID